MKSPVDYRKDRDTYPPRKAPTGFLAGSAAASQRGREVENGRAMTRARRGRNTFDPAFIVMVKSGDLKKAFQDKILIDRMTGERSGGGWL